MKGVNIPFMIMSLFGSIMLWAFVFLQNSKPIVPIWYSVHLEHTNLDKDELVVTQMDDVVRFSASGPDSVMQKMKERELAAYVDLARAKPGTAMYPVELLPQEFTQYVNGKQLSAKVTIEKVATKTVPVVVEGTGKLSDGNIQLGGTICEPKEVTVRGPESLIDKAAQARARLDLSKIDLSPIRPKDVAVDILDRDSQPLDSTLLRNDPMFVQITPVLTAAPQEKTAFVSPIFIGEPNQYFVSAGYVSNPTQVLLRGPSLLLAQVSKLVTEPIDITGIKEQTTFKTKLIVPKGLTVAGGNKTVTVKFYLRRADQTASETPPRVNTPHP